jgi:hypothetical protein
MSLLRLGKGGDSSRVTGLNQDKGLAGHRKIPAVQWAKLPRYWREGAVEVRPFPAKTRLRASEAQGLSGEAMKGNPTTTVILRVDESKSSRSNNRRLDRTLIPKNPRHAPFSFRYSIDGNLMPRLFSHIRTYGKTFCQARNTNGRERSK